MTSRMYARSRPRVASPLTVRGFTLVEIMVSVTIGLIILAAVAQIFATSRATFALEEDLARLQESGRFSLDFISQDVRMSGNLGCLRKFFNLGGTVVDRTKSRLNDNTNYGWNFESDRYMRGHTYIGSGGTTVNDWNPQLPPAYFTNGEVLPNTDVIVVRRALERSFRLTAATSPAGPVNIPIGNGLKDKDIVLITDCNDGDVFQITGGTPDTDGVLAHSSGGGPPGNAFGGELSKSYSINSEVMKLMTRIYFVGPGIDQRPTLFRKEIDDGTVTTQPVVDDVERMRVIYGEDLDTQSDNMANIYRQANAVVDWTRVVSVRIGLLVRTPNESGPDLDTRTYSLAGITVVPFNDRHQRRVFTSTIQIRSPISPG